MILGWRPQARRIPVPANNHRAGPTDTAIYWNILWERVKRQ